MMMMMTIISSICVYSVSYFLQYTSPLFVIENIVSYVCVYMYNEK